jgi:hypothetical protein
VDSDARTVSINSYDSADVGEYHAQILAKLDGYPSVRQLLPFKITITPKLATTTVTFALPPYFDP